MPSIKVQNGNLVNGAGQRLFLQGCNMSGMETTAIHKWTSDCWGDDGGPPKWAEYQKWKPNIVRIPLNAACFLNLLVAKPNATSNGWQTPWQADFYGTYRKDLKTAIDAARAIGNYIILDLHWCAPKVTLGGVTNYLAPMAQSPFADRDTGIPFWQELVAWLKATYPSGFNDIVFDLFNEPFLDSFSAGLSDVHAALKVGGTSTRLVNGTGSGNFDLGLPWALLGYQEALDTIRAAGATNVVICSGNSYSQSLQPWQKFLPNDPLGQVVFGWHPYPHANRPYGKTGSDAGAGTANFAQWALQIKAAGHPVLIGEDGDTGNRSDHIKYMSVLAAKSLDGYVTWQWNNTQPSNNTNTSFYLTQYAADGKTIVPVPGSGQAVFDFMTTNSSGVSTMTDLVASVGYTDVAGFPQGSAVDHILVTLTEAGGTSTSQSVAPGTASVSFPSVAPGTYTATVQAFPASGAGYGTAVTSNSVTVSAPVTVTLSLPGTLTLA